MLQQANLCGNLLDKKATHIRKRILEIIYGAKGGHIGGSLSSVDILTSLYFSALKVDPKNAKLKHRDRFILSKGHSVEGLYCVLAEAGFIPDELLNSYGKFQSILAGHPTVKVPGIEVCSGALGHGLSVGVGMALAARMDKEGSRVFVLMGDGEQGEGSIYEAAMSASHYNLDNLVAIIDRNNLQISGNTEDVMAIDPIKERWESLGWKTLVCDGHNIDQLNSIFQSIPVQAGKPHLVIAHTIKGKGVSFMENQSKWHHCVPNSEQFAMAIKELE
jgi:transketolase